jgi:hypothetical protein
VEKDGKRSGKVEKPMETERSGFQLREDQFPPRENQPEAWDQPETRNLYTGVYGLRSLAQNSYEFAVSTTNESSREHSPHSKPSFPFLPHQYVYTGL